MTMTLEKIMDRTIIPVIIQIAQINPNINLSLSLLKRKNITRYIHILIKANDLFSLSYIKKECVYIIYGDGVMIQDLVSQQDAILTDMSGALSRLGTLSHNIGNELDTHSV